MGTVSGASRGWWLSVALLATGPACELRELTGAQLFGATPADAAAGAPADAGALPANDAASPEAPVDASPPLIDAMAGGGPDVPPPPDLLPPRLITITGTVSSQCGGANVKVGAGGRHTCSHNGKGSYLLRVTETPWTTITISAQGDRYEPFPYSARIVLDPGGTTHNIDLVFDGACDALAAVPPCVCVPADRCDPS